MDTLNDLNQFCKKIIQYKRLVREWIDELSPSDATIENIQKLRTELQQSYSRLERAITQYGGTSYITDDFSGSKKNVFDVAFDAIRPMNSDENLDALNEALKIVNKAIGKLQAEGKSWEVELPKKPEKATKQPSKAMAYEPKAFIAHGGDSPALSKLKSFLEALGVEPLVVEEQPSEGRSVGENVDWYARQADCAIILATKGDIDGKTGRFIPRGNVLIEIGKSQELFKDRIIYLLQAGTNLPTNISEKVRVRFTSDKMDDAFIKIAKELKKFGILKAGKQ